uniref:Cubilin n=1 Tax=Hirondellea gigas TaxID=1518452 RepID=A0A6A7FUH2_9CRUS
MLLQNLSRVAQEVSSESHLVSNLNTFRNNLTEHKGQLDSLRTRVQNIDNTLTPMSRKYDEISRVLGDNGAAQLQNITNWMNSIASQTGVGSSSTLFRLQQRVTQVEARISDLSNYQSRIEELEQALVTTRNSSGSRGNRRGNRVNNRANYRLNRRLRVVEALIRRRECNSMPCGHGGTCIDGVGLFQCLCRPGWSGQTCADDVDECVEYAGTELGCQNGGTCLNTEGSYRCSCPSGFYGRHCTLKSDTCTTATGGSLCDHGDCFPQPSGGRSYSCRCHQGWRQATGSISCSDDVNECEAGRTNHCSSNPPVRCINIPGSYVCGACPTGYTGDGFRCTDINECALFNGGCSLSPRVQCINEVGGRRCGACPPGYTGDGSFCTPQPSPCLSSPCHHLAHCIDTLQHMLPNYYQCQCPNGYAGNGIGPFGCQLSNTGGGSTSGGGGSYSHCASNPCVHGTCVSSGASYLCHCAVGYTGTRCELSSDPCSSSPCRNGGSCSSVTGSRSFSCSCPRAYTGPTCTTRAQSCGGVLTGTGGIVHYPSPGIERYDHNISCAWRIVVQVPKVINITFTEFHLESGRSCPYDWLQIHDGRGSSSQLIGRFCGSSAPGVNNTLISTHNKLYLWFRSDHSRAGSGFTFNWTAQAAVCGGDLRGQDHGSINSPGYPGNYPNNRNCSWTIRVRPGKRILFHFAALAIETHPNCSYDKLEVRDGLSPGSALLAEYCSSQNPAPLTTSGSEASILFHTDPSSTDTGFHISYSSVPALPGCGGVLTGDMGTFSSPAMNGRYHHNMLCEWLIRVPAAETIDLNVTSFSLEGGRSCYYDYLEFRDGGLADSPLIGKYCGRRMPPSIQSSGNQLFVTFKTDSSVSYSGFEARYQVACGGEFIGPIGVIRSPYHPERYPHNRECIYVISQPVGKAIVLNFTSFDVEDSRWARRCIFDYVEIRDGASSSFPLLGHYCGPPSSTPPLIISTLNFLWIKFKTDASVANRGFLAHYTTIDIRCGGVLRDAFGSISSPNSPDRYPGNSDCTWVIEAPQDHVIQLAWQMFVLESHENCFFDYVEVFDNSTVSSSTDQENRYNTRYCGTNSPPVMTSQGNMVTIHFHSDSSVSHDGFAFTYHTLNASVVCGGQYHTESGVIKSPRYPGRYPPSRTCEWTITAPVFRQLTLNFTHFDVGRTTDCTDDYLEIRNGAYDNSPLMTKLCGRNITVPEILSHNQHLYLKMVSNRYYAGTGFIATWNGATTGCGGTMTSVNGEIISPGYPQPYHHRADCYWDIRVNEGSKISFHIVDIDMERGPNCLYDYIEVRDPKASVLLGRFCSSQSPISLSASSNELKVRFRSDYSSNGRGFKAQYFSDCITNLTGPHGVIESPNFPLDYPHHRNCSWTIRAPRGNSITVAFSHFDVEDTINAASTTCHYDYVEVRVGSQSDSSRTVKGHFCGARVPHPVSSGPGMDIMEVVFLSDYSVAKNGFRAEWLIVGCGGMYSKSSDEFTSPNYPNVYPANRDCEWHIETAPGTRVKITIHGFDIEAPTHTNDCVFDSLKVYGGPDITSPVLTSLCHKSMDTVSVTSEGNTALLVMRSDGSVRGNGFRVSYQSLAGGCGGLFTAPHGNIQSPNYPANYERNTDCTWTITVDPLHVVEFTFEDFDVEPHANCSYDYLMLFDGNDRTAPLLLQHCGSSVPSPAVWRSSGNSLTIRLKADPNIQSRGFKANYTTGCGARIPIHPGMTGELKSPNYPSNFRAGVTCTWHLEASEGERVQLVFNHLDIRIPEFAWNNGSCIADYVSIHDGATLDSPEQARYCGTSSPPTVYSSSRYLTVNMIIRMGHGVGFRATYSEVSVSCGGDLTSESGQLASPNYPDSYPSGYDCTWTITAGAGNRVQLTFSEFDIAESENCNTDYVEVHEVSAEGRLLMHNCSDQVMPSITANRALWIRFRSGDDSSAPGFLASFAMLHGRILYGSGEIVSPLYPHTYHGVGVYEWRVQGTGRYVAITVLQMNIELDPTQDICLSSLTIYDGWSDASVVLANLCGYEAPTAPIITSHVSAMIRFTSNSRFEGSRFRLRYETVEDRNETVTIADSTVDTDCQYHVYVNRSITISSPNYPQNYDNNLNCEWVIEGLPHNRLRLRLYQRLEESSQCSYDWIGIYNGVDGYPNWNRTHLICRRDQFVRFVSDGRFLKLRFRTDMSVTNRGFTAYINAVCGGTLRDTDGVIYSPGYPTRNYYSYLNCEWTIRVRPGRTIRIQFTEFHVLNTTVTCQGDYLLIRNGESLSSPYLGNGRYCGNNVPDSLVSSSNVVKLRFISDSTNTARGFHLRYSEESDSCSGSHHLSAEVPDVTIMTPNYPNLPHPHTECSWVITAPHDQTVKLEFQEPFDIVTSYDGTCDQAWVEVRDGGTLLAPSMGKFCGSRSPNSLQSSDSVIFFRYYSNVTLPHSGFKLTAKLGTCGGTIRFENSGVITSPGYPEAYEANINCTWTLVAPIGHYISFHFLNMAIHSTSRNCSADRGVLIIRELNSTGEILGRACGSNLPEAIDTASNTALVSFKAGTNPFSGSGFTLMYNVSFEECGGDLSGLSGSFSSPGYPHGYTHRRQCLWRIQGPLGKRIKLVFDDLDIMRRNRYSCRDYVLVYNGLDDHSPRMGRSYICGTQTGMTFNSSMNGMKIRFITRGHSTSKGFRVSWTATEEQECGGEISGSSGSLSSPGLERGYYNNSMHCVWTYHVPNASNSSLVISVGHLDIESYHDFIRIEGVTNGQRQLVDTVVRGNENSIIVLPYPTVIISFITDYSVNRTGWNLTYSLSPCGGYRRGPNDVIQSPGFPTGYPNSAHCAWFLEYQEGSQIEFEFTDFRLEDSIHHDYVRLLNGRYMSSPEIGRYTGTTNPGNVGPTMTNALHLIFLTDDSTTNDGFRAIARQHDAGCGGVFHGRQGNISSPGFPSVNYANNIECEWTIVVSPGHHIKLSFVQLFDIETTAGCTNDYVQVLQFTEVGLLEGADRQEQWEPRGKFCGKQIPQSVFSSGRRVKLHFQTNEAVQGSGFKASWTALCGGVFNSSAGVISSPDHPGRYPPNANCTYTINATPITFITITFISFDLEGYSWSRHGCRYDWVQVSYEGSYGSIANKFCGRELPPMITTRGTTTISFITDRSMQRTGFLANYTADSCGGEVTESGVITLPMSSGYHNNMNCRWNITAPTAKAIRFKFTNLHLERGHACSFDGVKIYDGFELHEGNLLGVYCGDHTSDLPILSSHSNTAIVLFHTDSSVTHDGFTLAVDFTYACGGVVNISSTTSTHTIRSLDVDSDGQYEPLLLCRWLLMAPHDQVVALTFTRFNLELQPENDTRICPYDYLAIYDGSSVGDEQLYRGCGSTAPTSPVVSSSNVMVVVFHSDSANQTEGFTATVTSQEHPCGSSALTASNTSQVLESPQYPQDYPVSIRCRWVITAPENRTVTIHFDDLDIEMSSECSKDALYINDIYPGTDESLIFTSPGNQHDSNYITLDNGIRVRLHNQYEYNGICGSTKPQATSWNYRQVVLRFRSDEQNTGHGFRLHYSISTCNRTYSAAYGTLSARIIEDGTECTAVVQAPVGSFIAVYFHYLSLSSSVASDDTGCGSNSLRVYDGDSMSAPLLETLCGYFTPSPIYSSGNQLTLVMHADNQNSNYLANYVISDQRNGCGGNIQGVGGYLMSPGYPATSPSNLDCIFTLTVPSPAHAYLMFRAFDFGGLGGCNSTYMEIYDVLDDNSSNFMARYCGDETPAPHMAAGNRVIVRYTTGIQVSGQGWMIGFAGAQLHPQSVEELASIRISPEPSTTMTP